MFRDFYVSNRTRAIDKNNESINTLWLNKKKIKLGMLPDITEPIIEAVPANQNKLLPTEPAPGSKR